MMLEVFQENWLLLLLALFLGLFIAWWIWSKPAADAHYDDSVNDADSSGNMLSGIEAMTSGANADAKSVTIAHDTEQSLAEKTAEVAKDAGKAAKATSKKAGSKTASATKIAVTAPKKKAANAKGSATAKKAASAKDSASATAKKAAANAKKTSDKAKNKVVKTEPKAKQSSVKTAVKPDATKAAPKKPAPKKPAPKEAVKASPPKATNPAIPNDLELLKGVGPKLNKELKAMGVISFEQVAAWKAADIAAIDEKLGKFSGRITRDNWVDQAKLLSKGDIKGFEKKYGSLGSEIK